MNPPETRLYEVSFLALPTLHTDLVAEFQKDLINFIEEKAGSIAFFGKPELIELSYEMEKVISNKHIRFTTAYFSWLKFTLEPRDIKDLDAFLTKHAGILRFLILKAENYNSELKRKDTNVKVQRTNRAPKGASDVETLAGEEVLKSDLETLDPLEVEIETENEEKVPLSEQLTPLDEVVATQE
jgi:ribosomal protein S6